ncbi:GNAT family N-acetyltransferase [Streptomyces sp. LP05-1]|uniref:GNAT family N-acetyltransferase n=1 Tax=Streptomyces pyxinae TaxID=2970734 RepID=A0ABT2CGX2_9ACTN|nr:GNAT family protein [Streptomyces sp. LP05-1]MCS0636667.1 GNAT family N-acetyltransferase [Streptomyces sp. LP05-1]
MFGVSLGEDGAELRPLEPWQAEEYFAHLERGREYIGRYVGLADACHDLESSRALLQRFAEKAAADEARIYGIWLDGTLVGGVLFVTFDVAHGTAEAGCWLEPAAAGRGLVTRAVRVLIDWAVEVRGIHRVEWVAGAENAASIAVARRVGMTKEGTRRGCYLHRGVRQDMEVWSVLAPEWRELKGRA